MCSIFCARPTGTGDQKTVKSPQAERGRYGANRQVRDFREDTDEFKLGQIKAEQPATSYSEFNRKRASGFPEALRSD
jgi:hypothetical protein